MARNLNKTSSLCLWILRIEKLEGMQNWFTAWTTPSQCIVNDFIGCWYAGKFQMAILFKFADGKLWKNFSFLSQSFSLKTSINIYVVTRRWCAISLQVIVVYFLLPYSLVLQSLSMWRDGKMEYSGKSRNVRCRKDFLLIKALRVFAIKERVEIVRRVLRCHKHSWCEVCGFEEKALDWKV